MDDSRKLWLDALLTLSQDELTNWLLNLQTTGHPYLTERIVETEEQPPMSAAEKLLLELNTRTPLPYLHILRDPTIADGIMPVDYIINLYEKYPVQVAMREDTEDLMLENRITLARRLVNSLEKLCAPDSPLWKPPYKNLPLGPSGQHNIICLGRQSENERVYTALWKSYDAGLLDKEYWNIHLGTEFLDRYAQWFSDRVKRQFSSEAKPDADETSALKADMERLWETAKKHLNEGQGKGNTISDPRFMICTVAQNLIEAAFSSRNPELISIVDRYYTNKEFDGLTYYPPLKQPLHLRVPAPLQKLYEQQKKELDSFLAMTGRIRN
ncbi:MAG: hypothetical protein V1743_01550 [Nanoarchaeota archaeon]